MIVPDAIEPFVGWRVWRVCPGVGYDLELRSLYTESVWPHRQPVEMRCSRRGDGTPCPPQAVTTRHQCGVHGSKSIEGALRYLPQRLRERRFEPVPVLPSTGLVYGTVALWGEVEETTLSYRAQFAYPQHLYVPVSFGLPGWTAMEAAATLGDAYGVPWELVRYAGDALAA